MYFHEFDNADAAIKYRDKLKEAAPSEISGCLHKNILFTLFRTANLELLKQNKNLQSYMDLLNKKYPGKF